MDRAQFLKRGGLTLGALAGAGGLSGVIGACGGGSSPSTSGTDSGTPATGSLKGPSDVLYADIYPELPRGGNLRMGIAQQIPSTLDVLTGAAGATFWSADPVHDFLEAYNPDGSLGLSLAKSVEEKPTEIRYVVRDGVKFHNGRVLTPEDVKKTLDFCMTPKNLSVWADRTANIKSVRVIDDKTVSIRLKAPNADQRALLTAIPIVPIEEQKKASTAPVGCGPFVLKRWLRGAYIEYTKFDGYWNPDAPRLDALRINHYATAATGVQAYLSNTLDCLAKADLAQKDQLSSQPDSKLLDNQTGGVVHVACNIKVEPFNDPRVRRAIALTVDREQMATDPFNGLSVPRWFLGITPESPFYPKDLEYARNVDEAKRLMAEAGHATGFKTRLLTANIDYFQGVATVAKSNLAEIGIDADLEIVDLDTAIDRLLVRKDFVMSVLGFAMDPAPSARVDRYVYTDGPGNYFSYSSRDADMLLDKAKATTATEARKRLYHQAFQKIFVEDAAVIPVAAETSLSVYKTQTSYPQFYAAPGDRFHYPIAAISA